MKQTKKQVLPKRHRGMQTNKDGNYFGQQTYQKSGNFFVDSKGRKYVQIKNSTGKVIRIERA